MTDTNPAASPIPQPASPPPPPPPVAFGPATTAAPPMLPAGFKSPAAAGALNLMPGLGHLYLGLYQRGAIFFGVFVLLASLANHSHGPFPGLFFPFLFAFAIIDAVRQAKAINATGAPEPGLLTGEKPVKVSGSLTAGILLVLIGGFLLLNRFVPIDLSFLNDWWPAFLVLFGGWQIFSYWKGKQDEPKPEA